MRKKIDILIAHFHKVENICTAPDEKQLHGSVIQRYEVSSEKVEVTRHEHSYV